MFLQLNARPKITHADLQDQEIVEERGGMGHSIYLQKLQRCSVTITSKVNRLVVEHCVDCTVVFRNLISGLEVVHSQGIVLKDVGQQPAPTVQTDMSSGCHFVWQPSSLHETKFVFAAVSDTTFSEFDNAEDPLSPFHTCFRPENVGDDQHQVIISAGPERQLSYARTSDLKAHIYTLLN